MTTKKINKYLEESGSMRRLENLLGYEIKYLPVTETKPSRIKITNGITGESITQTYKFKDDYREQAIFYLESIGIKIIGIIEMKKTTIVFTDDFTTSLKK